MKKTSQSLHKNSAVIRKRINKKNSDYELEKVKELDPNLVTRLKNIIEVTEEQEHTQRFNEIEDVQENVHLIKQQKQKTLSQRSLQCLKIILNCFKKESPFIVSVSDRHFLMKIEELREKGIKTNPLLTFPPQSNKKTIVLDIDLTLIHPSITKIQQYDFSFKLTYKDRVHTIYGKNRFGLQLFLFEISQHYEIIVYSSGNRNYVDGVLDVIDSKRRISARLYRESCIQLNKVYFLKSLKILGRDPNKVIFIDNNPASGVLQPHNFLQIKCFKGQSHDRELIKLIPFLKQIAEENQITPIYKKYQEFTDREVKMKYNTFDKSVDKKMSFKRGSFKFDQFDGRQNDLSKYFHQQQQKSMEKKRKIYGHQRNNSEFQNLSYDEENDNKQENEKEDEEYYGEYEEMDNSEYQQPLDEQQCYEEEESKETEALQETSSNLTTNKRRNFTEKSDDL